MIRTPGRCPGRPGPDLTPGAGGVNGCSICRKPGTLRPCPRIGSSCAARASTTSRTSASPSRATAWSSSPACPGAASPASPSTPSTPRASAATSRACPPTPASSWARWRSPTSTRSTASRPPSPSTRRAPVANPRSTVGTVTEIYDYLRLLFARIGHPHCPNCGREIERQTRQPDRGPGPRRSRRARALLVLGPLIKDRKTEGDRVFEGARKQGFVRVRVDGEPVRPVRGARRSTSTSATPSRSSSTGSSCAAPRRRGLGARRRRPADRSRDGQPSRTRTRRASPTRSRRRSGWARASW